LGNTSENSERADLLRKLENQQKWPIGIQSVCIHFVLHQIIYYVTVNLLTTRCVIITGSSELLGYCGITFEYIGTNWRFLHTNVSNLWHMPNRPPHL